MEDLVLGVGNIREEKVFDGAVLPKTLTPLDSSRSSRDDLVNGIERNKDWICSALRQHGAVLFRGFEVDGACEFRQVVEAFGWEDMPYVGIAPRVKVEERVYTANDSPLHLFIVFHHEMSLMKSQPSMIFFYCETPPPEGGQTSLIRSNVLLKEFEKQHPEFVQKLECLGFLFDLMLPKESTAQSIVGRSLTSLVGTDDPLQLEKRAKEAMGCSSVKLMEDGSAKVTFGPFDAIRTLQGEKLLFYYNNQSEDGGNLRLGDGSAVPKQVTDTYTKIVDEMSVDITWQKGDVLLVDNFSTQHGRRPGKPPRRVFTSLCK